MSDTALSQSAIAITVKLFAAYQEAYGVPELTLEVPVGTTVVEVRDRLISEHPELAQWRDLTRFGINLQFVEADAVLHAGDEVVLIPPVSGG
ncbi:MoaD/ThiS family protein [Leptolyngbya sp. FACHB-671]|uniref:MoaD/ThiS family protein n=1 Tax=Leptolyngbya sp. FACHB-671 TaxID=2692812 RepID=UPI00168994E3|nr:MoaD/ThiS family protein [Leptolyngbya sp. FACHB-671]MBD2071288.1 MoaD/ThiS family protein [Leptolyngbya sp. FACHB-671]